MLALDHQRYDYAIVRMQHLCYQNSGGAEIHTNFIYMECKYTCGYI